jgi:parvulin-like peptidyl-prolyl isomerase
VETRRYVTAECFSGAFKAAVAVAAATLLSTAATAAAQPIRDLGGARLINAIVASVDGKPITLRDLRLYESGKAKLLPPENRNSPQAMLEALVTTMMFDAEFARLGIQASDEDVNQYIDRILQQNGGTREQVTSALEKIGLKWSDYFDRMRGEVQRLALVNREIRSRVNVTPEEVKRYWKESDEYLTPEQIEVADIYMPFSHDLSPAERELVERRVHEAYEKARKDGFGKAAKLYSSGPTADDGGILGTFKRGTMALPFERVVAKLDEGDVSKPFQVDNAYHILKLVRVVPRSRRPYEEVEGEIREKLYSDHLEERFTRWTQDDLRKRYHVTLHYDHVAAFL